MTASVNAGTTREEFSERLLKGSVKKSYAPIVDIDWDAPLDPDKFFLPPNTVSLYGTPLWDAMTREQQIELSRQEFVNTLSAGIWFENILNQALLRDLMHQDPTASATHYALTELGDETRHMVMFGKAIERVGGKPVRPRLLPAHRSSTRCRWRSGNGAVGRRPGRRGDLRRAAAPDHGRSRTAADGAAAHADSRHRGGAPHPVRPRRAAQAVPHMPWTTSCGWPTSTALGGLFFRYLFTNRVPYRRAGLDAREARRIARHSPHRREVQVTGFAPLAAFLEEVGLMGPIARRLWRRTGFLPR